MSDVLEKANAWFDRLERHDGRVTAPIRVHIVSDLAQEIRTLRARLAEVEAQVTSYGQVAENLGAEREANSATLVRMGQCLAEVEAERDRLREALTPFSNEDRIVHCDDAKTVNHPQERLVAVTVFELAEAKRALADKEPSD